MYIDFDILYGTAISGTVSLPDGDVAPAGGIEVNIIAFNDNGTPFEYHDDSIYYYTYTIIPEGQSSASYFLPHRPFFIGRFLFICRPIIQTYCFNSLFLLVSHGIANSMCVEILEHL